MNPEVKVLQPEVVRSRVRVLDFLELMKPELTGLSVLTTLFGFYLATNGSFPVWIFLHTALGTLLIGGGAGALNQYIERSYDALMKRTERRPLPSRRLTPQDALIFGAGISLLGMLELWFFVNALTCFLGIITWATYLFLYTPLKRVTPASTVVGGIPGALPPVMGWAAARNEISAESIVLFAILFCWQMPHFFSLAWMYRKDYERAGFKILTVFDHSGTRTGRQILFYTAALIPLTLGPAFLGMTGWIATAGALLLGSGFLILGSMPLRYSGRSGIEAVGKLSSSSRRIFFASLIYLPVLMLMMAIDKL